MTLQGYKVYLSNSQFYCGIYNPITQVNVVMKKLILNILIAVVSLFLCNERDEGEALVLK